MKKFTAIMMTFLTLSFFVSIPSALAWENKPAEVDLSFYYDINGDSKITVADLVLCRQDAISGVMTANDLEILTTYLLTGEMPNISFREVDIDDLASDENLDFVNELTSGVLVDCDIYNNAEFITNEMDFITSVSYRFLKDGMVTEVHCERICAIQETLKHFDCNGRRVTLGITKNGEFAWDEESFDLVPGIIDPNETFPEEYVILCITVNDRNYDIYFPLNESTISKDFTFEEEDYTVTFVIERNEENFLITEKWSDDSLIPAQPFDVTIK